MWRGGPHGPAGQTRQPPPGAQPEDGVAESAADVLANTDSWRSTRRLPQLGQATVLAPVLTGCSFWKCSPHF
jgi:hypothetical protein